MLTRGRTVVAKAAKTFLALGLLLMACVPPTPTPTAGGRSQQAAPETGSSGRAENTLNQRVLHLLARDDPAMMSLRFDRNGQGFPLTVPLLYRDEQHMLRGMLAVRPPSQDDGSWVVNADGTMKTTYTLKPDLKWQDGKPHTAHDFVFTWQVYMDPNVAITTRLPESLMSEVVARDDQTLDILWKSTYIGGNALIDNDLAPIPRHLLEDVYRADRSAFTNNSFWTTPGEFVGNGPYRLTEWERGVSLKATANPHFVLGRPKIDAIEIHFVQDANAAVANFLSGVLDFGQYTAVTAEMGVTIRDRWSASNEGKVFADTVFGVRIMEFQHRDVPGAQKAVTDLRVRRALMHAIDRDIVAEELQYGFSTAADTLVPRNFPVFSRVDQAITKYPYDLRRTEQLLIEAGWTKGADGTYRDATGQLLDMEMRATSENGQLAQIISDFWKRAGMNSSPYVIPRAQLNDQEVRTSFPAASLSNNGGFGEVTDVTAEQAPTPQNRFTGKNRGTYLNPRLDDLFAQYLRQIDAPKRDDLIVDMARLFSADVSQGTLIYLPQVAAMRTGLVGIKAPPTGSYLWNLWEWSWS